MRTVVTAVAICLGLSGTSLASENEAAVKRQTLIPAQALSPALQAFAKERNLQLVYATDEVQSLRTAGATGELTASQALAKLLSGTGLTFRYLDDHTITVEPILPLRRTSQEISATALTRGTVFFDDNDSADQGREYPQRVWLAQAGTTANAGASSPGRSQAASGADSKADEGIPVTLDQVIVTAQKREERILDVPISITAFTDASLKDRGATQLADILMGMPGVGIVDSQASIQSIEIRGISSSFGDSPIGYYLDELPFSFIGSSSVPDVRTYDLERVEVLRGPQGTLYGDGSIGGTIRILTADPNLKSLQADVDLAGMKTTDSSGSYTEKGMLNLPLKEGTLGLRLVAGREDYAGWIDDPGTGDEDRNKREINNFRGKLRWTPFDDLDLIFSAWHTREQIGDGATSTEARTTAYPQVHANLNYNLYSLTARYSLGFADLISASSWMDLDTGASGTLAGSPYTSTVTTTVRSEELRLTSAGDGALRWTGGLFYRDTDQVSEAHILTFNSDDVSGSREYAIFGEGTWATFNRKLELTLGARYFKNDRGDQDKALDPATLAFIQTIDPEFTGRADATFHAVSPRFNAAWHLDDNWLLYTNIAKGMRPGQVQPVTSLLTAAFTNSTLPIGIQQETLWSYEVGSKGTFADGRAVVEAAVYYNDWKNLQLNVVLDPATQVSGLDNGGNARTVGEELSLMVRPIDGLDLTLTGSHIDAKYTQAVAGVNIHPGQRVTGVPQYTASFASTYRWPLTNALKGFVYGNAQYTSDIVDVINGAAPSDSISTVNMRLGVEARSWSAYLFAENLTDNRGAQSVEYVGQPGVAIRMRPRTIGLNVRFSYR